MPKDIPVGNGKLLFNFDSDYRIRDVYFPYIGQENHSKGDPFRFGVWVDGQCSWMGTEWEKDLRYHDNSLVTDVYLKNESLGLELRCHDVVDVDLNVYIKKIEVLNLQDKERQARLFFSNDFHLYGNAIGDTAYFDPRTDSIIHYKANRYFLISCCVDDNWGVNYFACGDKEVPGRLGTWKDADEDGELSGNPISWGSADSTIGIWLDLPSGGKAEAFYWVAAGTSYEEVAQLNHDVREKTPEVLIKRTSDYWEAWAKKESKPFGDLPKSVTDIFNRSLLILRTQIDNRGAITAANDSDMVHYGRDTYSYMWGRDGAFVAAALAKAGYSHICMRFFEFCSRVMSEDGYLFQRYNPDGSIASNWLPWLLDGKEIIPIQEDSTALVIWALWIHYENTKNIEFIRGIYEGLIKRSADFLVAHRDTETLLPIPSYDLWEERFGVHTFTVASVIAGLRAAARFSRLFQDERAEEYDNVAEQMKEGLTGHLYHEGLNRYARSGYKRDGGYELDEVIDVSLLGLNFLGILPADDPRMVATAEAIREQLWLNTQIGGCARYRNDVYQRPNDSPKGIPGNPWFIATLWLGEYFIDRAKNPEELQEAIPYLEWCAKNALPSGVLAEQVHPANGSPLSV
ncbi:MAG: glycoside hydrolase family 15 protein, partial [Thermodesulfovibrionales bacterium]